MVHFEQLHRSIDSRFKAANRYFDILPYSYNLCPVFDALGHQTYVNASFIDIPLIEGGSKAFIAASAPLKKSMQSWWDLIISNKVEMVFMLCDLVEKNVPKCDAYFDDNDASLTFGNIIVQTLEVEELNESLIEY